MRAFPERGCSQNESTLREKQKQTIDKTHPLSIAKLKSVTPCHTHLSVVRVCVSFCGYYSGGEGDNHKLLLHLRTVYRK